MSMTGNGEGLGGAEERAEPQVGSEADPIEASPRLVPPATSPPVPAEPPPPTPPPNSDRAADHSGEVLTAAHAEARQRAESGDLTGARTLLEEALAAGELRHGRDHPQLAPLMVDLATIARNVGNLTEAQNQLRRAYGIVVAAAGPDHATALSIEGRLAAVNYRLGEPTEAYDWHIADVGARVLGPDHPAVRGAQQRLAATPVHEERTPPVEAPAEWPASYAAAGYVVEPLEPSPYGAADESGGWAPQYSTYPPEPSRSTALEVYSGDPAAHGYGRVEAWAEPMAVEVAPRTRGHAGGVALVASLGLAIIVAAAVIAYQLFGPGIGSTPNADGPTPAGSASASTPASSPDSTPTPSDSTSPGGTGAGLPPSQVTLKDESTSITLTWVDPSSGQVPFIITGGIIGETAGPVVSVPAGHTSQTIYGLNPHYNYCFTVAAVWSANAVEASQQTCTKRAVTVRFRSSDQEIDRLG